MASMTTAMPIEKPNSKPSFAKVAASPYKPQVKATNSPSTTPNPSNVPDQAAVPKSITSSNSKHVPISHNVEHNTEKVNGASPTNATGQAEAWSAENGPQVQLPDPSQVGNICVTPRMSVGSLMTSNLEERTSQSSSSGEFHKPPSLDGKSVASGTTFAMDEKESLRPDDSASIRAIEEEDVTSPPESAAAGSRIGSDSGARAFRDQMNEIAHINNTGLPRGRGPPSFSPMPPLVDAPANFPPIATSIAQPQAPPQLINLNGNGSFTGMAPPGPDEKLLEALESPRDRLFVLKLEQDLTDFVKDPKESTLDLPHTNSFYRMLAHRLADYFLLEHTIQGEQSALRITRTTNCRIPPSLADVVKPASTSNTPPINLQARKIMRRGQGVSGNITASNSEGPSKTTSENGGDSGSDGVKEGQEKLSARELKLAKYEEARRRIFGDTQDKPAIESTEDGEEQEKEKDDSRASSASGKKKGGKKQRNYSDDGFESRYQFSAYYGPSYAVSGYSGECPPMYNAAYPAGMPSGQYPMMQPNMSPNMQYANPYPGVYQGDPQAQYNWSQQNYANSNVGLGVQPYGAPYSPEYDMSAQFNQAMSFQSPDQQPHMSPNMSSPQSASIRGGAGGYQSPPNHGSQAWSPMSPQCGFQPTQGMYMQPISPQQMSPPTNTTIPYPFGQLPNPDFTAGKGNKSQHPIPGSFNRQQFNPQSQTFVPGGGRNVFQQGHLQQRSPMPQMLTPAMPAHNPMPMQSPHNPPHGHSLNAPPMQNGYMLSSPRSPMPNGANGAKNTHSSKSDTSPRNVSNSSESSIAKWGTPASLPPKPPAPASVPTQPQQKFPLPNTPPVVARRK